MNNSDKKIIIFDMDGVLINSIGLMYELSRNRYEDISENDFKEMFTGNLLEQIDNNPDTYKKHNASPEEQLATRKAYTHKKVTEVVCYKGIKTLLDTLQERGLKMSVNTSASGENTFPILERLSLNSYFDQVLTRDLVRSKTEKFKHLFDYYHVEAHNMVFVTDSLGDVLEAKVVNVPTIGVTWGVHDREFFEREEHDNLIALVDTPEALTEVLLKLSS